VAAGASLALAGELAFLAARGTPAETTAAIPVIAVVVGAAGLIIAAALARNEDAIRRHSERVQLIGDPTIDALDDESLLSTLATRLGNALGADQVAVLLAPGALTGEATATGGSAQVFEVVASIGIAETGATIVPATSFPADGPAGVKTRPAPLPPGWGRAANALSQPVTGEGATEGMVYVGWAGYHMVRPDEERLVALTAGRVWSVVHRRRLVDAERRARLSAEGARRQLAVLAYGGTALASALDSYEAEVTALAEVCVPAFADLCVIHLVDDDGRLQPAANRVDRASDLEVPSLEAWREPLERALVEGRTRFGFVGGAGGGDELADEVIRRLGASSAIVVPVQAGGLSLGTITMATGAGRRGFRSSDKSVAEDMAGRLAVAIQRVLLHREVVASAEAQTRAAQRLHETCGDQRLDGECQRAGQRRQEIDAERDQ